jgi:hypothetical protein
MTDLLSTISGAGAFAAFAAPLMIIGVLLRGLRLGRMLQRFAAPVALLLPLAFMILFAVVLLPTPVAKTFFDFEVNHQAARAMYGMGESPYTVPDAYSFPFPTFYLYWVFSGFGALPETASWVVWWLVNAVVWIGCAVVLFRTLKPPRNAFPLFIYTCAAIPAMATLWQGQTALFILAGLTALHVGLQDRRYAIVGGVGLAFAAMIKPQLALVGLGLAALWVFSPMARRAHTTVLVSAVISGLAALVLTVIIPGGVTLDTYREFFTAALPQVAQPTTTDLVTSGSPAFVASWLALQAGAPPNVGNLVSNSVTGIMIIAGLYWTWQRRDRLAIEVAAAWGVWAMIAPRVAWTWYAAWCLPFFLLALDEDIRRGASRGRLVLYPLLLGVYSLQASSLVLNLTANVILFALVWSAFRENIKKTSSSSNVSPISS